MQGEGSNLPAAHEGEPGQRLAVALLLLGAALRVAHFVLDRSLWLDEVMLARNIVARSFGRLLQPLDYNQAAPVGFLWLEKLSVTFLGSGEAALRLVPLVAMLLSLPLFARIARRALPQPAAALSLCLFVLSPSLVYYAAECKQFALDVCVALALWCLADSVQGRTDRRAVAALGAAGAAAIWFSHAAVFSLCGMGAALALCPIGGDSRAGRVRLAAVVGPWLLSAAAAYTVSMSKVAANTFLAGYWASGFLPLPPVTASDAGAWTRAFGELFRVATSIPLGPVTTTWTWTDGAAFVVAVLAVRRLARHNRPLATMLTFTVVAALAAAALHKYPIQGRLVLFTVPISCLAAVAGLDELLRHLSSTRRAPAMILVALGLALPPTAALVRFYRQPYQEELRPVLQQLHRRVEADDVLYLHLGSVHAFRFYTTQRDDCSVAARDIRVGSSVPKPPDYSPLVADLDRLHGAARVWFVFSHDWGRSPEERPFLLAQLDRRGRSLFRIEEPGASAYLYDLRGSGAPGTE